MSAINTLNHLINHPLNKHARLSAVKRFLKWQIGSRILPGPAVIPWLNDSSFIASNGETGLTGNIYCGLHEFEDMAFIIHCLRKEDLFFDIGANVGSYTILAGAVCGAEVVSFEPVPSTFARLRHNIKINDLEE